MQVSPSIARRWRRHPPARTCCGGGGTLRFYESIQRRLDVAVPEQCSAPLAVEAGQPRKVGLVGEDLSISAPRGRIVGGAYLAGTHLPVSGARFTLEPTPEGTYPLAGERYEFRTVSASFTVRMVAPEGYAVVEPAARQVTVPPGGTVEADFYVRPTTCQFVLGFATLRDAIPAIVGDCLENEQHHSTDGDGWQHTANGLLVWRKADNVTAFTDGYRTWVNGPAGLQERLNTQRFAREANPSGLPVAS